MEQKSKIIYSLKIMKQLLEKGIFPLETKNNPTNPEYLCWIYEITDELVVALDEIFEGGQEDG